MELAVTDELEQLAPVLAAQGNIDRPEVNTALSNINSMKIYY